MPARLLRTARGQLIVVLIGLLLLATASAITTYLAVKRHDQDYITMDLITSERDLVQQLSWFALADPQNTEFPLTAKVFQQNLEILRNGGEIVDVSKGLQTIPITDQPRIQDQIDELLTTWQTARNDAQALWSLPLGDPQRDTAILTLRGSMPLLLRDLGDLQLVYEQHMDDDIGAMDQAQVLYLLCAIPLLVWGYLIIRWRIVRPAAVLAAAARTTQQVSAEPDLRAEALTDELDQLLPSFAITHPEMNAAHKLVEFQISERTQLLMSAFATSQEIVGQFEFDQILTFVPTKTAYMLNADAATVCLSTGEYAPQQLACKECAFNRVGTAYRLQTLLQSTGRSVGALCVVRDTKPFDPNDQRILDLLGSATAVAISNAKLAQSSRNDAQVSAIMEERKRMTAEIHDNLAQTLSYLSLQVAQTKELVARSEGEPLAAEIESIQSATHHVYHQVRSLLSNLREPTVPAAAQSLEAITAFVDDLRHLTDFTIDLQINPADIDLISPLAQTQVYNIIREALTNVHRHAQATHVQVRSEHVHGSVIIAIEDDGIGFDRANHQDDDAFGLAIMQARAERSGGTLIINSVIGMGTSVLAHFPVGDLPITHADPLTTLQPAYAEPTISNRGYYS